MPKVKIDGEVRFMSFPELQEALMSGNPPEVVQDEGTVDDDADRDLPTTAADAPVYEEMSRAELDALAAERGVDVSQARTKADVIAILKA